MSDIEIARAAQKKPIFEIGESLSIPSADLLPFGHDKAKISQGFINSVQGQPHGKLILVTAINPRAVINFNFMSLNNCPCTGRRVSSTDRVIHGADSC